MGIKAQYSMIDPALMKQRTNSFDFQMTHYIRSLSLSPGTEQFTYWGTQAAKTEGSRNWPGITSPAIDAVMEKIVTATDAEEFTADVKVLDRLLTAGRYVIPIWYADRARVAHVKELRYPEHLPLYGDWIGFLPDLWWYEASE